VTSPIGVSTFTLALLGGLAAVAALLALLYVRPRVARWWTGRSTAGPSVDHHADPLTTWEKAALFTTGAGGAYNILLYQLGFALADAAPGAGPLWWSRVLFGLVSFVGFDLTLVVTVMAMRAGRRSAWAWVTVATAALAAAGIALDVSAVWPQPWLHAAPVVVLACFMLHVAAPRAGRGGPAVDQLTQERDEARATVGHLRAELVQTQERMGLAVDHADAEVVRLRAELAQRPQLVDQSGTDAALSVAGRSISLTRLAQIVGVPKSTLVRKLDRADQEGGYHGPPR
jgi:hypothetical protein